MDNKVVTRFAPSPTGFLHVGGVRTALFAWLWARKNNGTFILRIEDTDKKREVSGSIEHIIASLKWLGIDWDEGVDIGGPNAPYKQSERLDTYIKYANILVDKGLAYSDPYSEEEVENFRKEAIEKKKAFFYRDHRSENPPAWKIGMPLRFKNTPKKYKWHDMVRGDLEAGEEALDDLILIKKDGYPTYNFAHIIDDLLMGVNYIFRADEFISSTPNYLALYEALEIKRPEFATLPPILGDAGTKKLGKRDGAKDILDYKKEGYLPEAMLNFLAFIGWNPGEGDNREVMSKNEIINSFDLKHVQRAGAKFNPDKLDWLNKEHMNKLENAEYIEKGKSFIDQKIIDIKKLSKEELDNLILQSKGRITKFIQLEGFILGYTAKPGLELPIEALSERVTPTNQETIRISGPNDYINQSKDPIIGEVIKLLRQKNLMGDDEKDKIVLDYLTKAKDLLEKDYDKTVEKKEENELWIYSGEKGRGKVLGTLRLVLSGESNSDDPFEIMKKIGKESSLRRIVMAIETINLKIKDLDTQTGQKIDTFTIKN